LTTARKQTYPAVKQTHCHRYQIKKPLACGQHSKVIGWNCGAVIFFPDDQVVDHYTDVQKSVDDENSFAQSLRTGEDLNICVVCQDAYKEVQCVAALQVFLKEVP
jgi:hypothetical protein